MSVERDEVVDCTNPKLDVYLRVDGILTDAYSLEFIIYERVTAAPALTQVYPVAGRATVDLTDCPTGDKLSTGRYIARWTVPTLEPVGFHEIHWFYRETAAHPEKQTSFEFAVTLPGALTSDESYISVQDVRDEGLSDTELSDTRAQFLINGWSRWFDHRCGQWFYEKQLTMDLDGNGSRVMWFPVPIIDLQEMYINDDFDNVVDTTYYTVYNRYFPDDRRNPSVKLKRRTGSIFETVRDMIFEVGDMNQRFIGTFGYVEEDGTVPFLIQRAIMTLVLLTAELKSDGEIDDLRSGLRIEEVTDRHRIRFSDLYDEITAWKPTGLVDVDEALALYRRPATVDMARSFVVG